MKKLLFYCVVIALFVSCSKDDDIVNIFDLPQESNIIYYISSDGEVINPYEYATFGAKIRSNIYQDGYGVITFDNKVTEIGKQAFSSCRNLVNIVIPNSVTLINDSAFYGCTSLTTINLGDNISEIRDGAFMECHFLSEVDIPNSVTSIGGMAFKNCSRLSDIRLPNKLTTIEAWSFSNCGIKSITIPESVTSICEGAFNYCYSLESVTIPNSVKTLGAGIFVGCANLSAIYGKFASKDNRCLVVDGVLNSFAPKGLSSYTIPDNITTIGFSVFYYSEYLNSVIIPNSITAIDSSAFEFCESLENVYCNAVTPPFLGLNVFDNNPSLKNIFVPKGTAGEYKLAWSSYANLISE